MSQKLNLSDVQYNKNPRGFLRLAPLGVFLTIQNHLDHSTDKQHQCPKPFDSVLYDT